MTSEEIISAWKADKDEGKDKKNKKDKKSKKSKKEEKAPPNPVGDLQELSDEDMAHVAGGTDTCINLEGPNYSGS